MDQKGWEQWARDRARIPPMLAGLVDWCNANLPLDPKKPVTAADIAHVRLTAAEFSHVPGDATPWCSWRKHFTQQAHGIEFWMTRQALPELRDIADLRGRIAWRLTGNTAALFRWRGPRND